MWNSGIRARYFLTSRNAAATVSITALDRAMARTAAQTIADAVREKFASLHGVTHVDVCQHHEQDLVVNITVNDFSRTVRDPIYDAQRELPHRLDSYFFEFRI